MHTHTWLILIEERRDMLHDLYGKVYSHMEYSQPAVYIADTEECARWRWRDGRVWDVNGGEQCTNNRLDESPLGGGVNIVTQHRRKFVIDKTTATGFLGSSLGKCRHLYPSQTKRTTCGTHAMLQPAPSMQLARQNSITFQEPLIDLLPGDWPMRFFCRSM